MAEQRHAQNVDGRLDVFGLEVRDADPVDQFVVVQLLERPEGVLGIVLAGRPVDVQQVDAVDAQLVETLLGAVDHVLVGQLVDPHLRREEHVLAVDVGGGDALADGVLVAVRLCGVDVTIPHLQGRPYGLGALFGVRVLPGSQSESRHPARAGSTSR